MPTAEPGVPVLPLVSVIVPTHGRCRLLHELLQSLAAQTYPRDRYEILVVHNVSPDGTAEMVAEFARQHGDIAVSYHAKNYPGPTASRNFGAREARGTILAYIDDDCVATPEWLAEGVGAFAGSDGAGLIQGRTLPNPEQPRQRFEKTVTVDAATPYFETCNIFYRKEIFFEAGGFSPEFETRYTCYGEDTDLGWKIKRLGYETGFAAGALAYHQVFAVSVWKWLAEPQRLFIWPYLVRKFPELRKTMVAGVFLTPLTALFDLFLLGLVLGAGVHPVLFGLCLPYPVVRYRDPGRFHRPWQKAARIVLALPRALVIFLVLATASLWFRSVAL